MWRKKDGTEKWPSEKKVISIAVERMRNDRHPHINIMMKLKTNISVYLLISGSEEEIFPKNVRGGLFW